MSFIGWALDGSRSSIRHFADHAQMTRREAMAGIDDIATTITHASHLSCDRSGLFSRPMRAIAVSAVVCCRECARRPRAV